MKYDVCVIGGGAAGLAAAASFNKDLKVCVLEKNDRLGRKLGATGGGRCNLTNEACENRNIVLNFFRNAGLETFMDEEGRYYPYSQRASDVVETLTHALGINVTVKCDFNVQYVAKAEPADNQKGLFLIGGIVKGRKEEVAADEVILAMGGKAAPQYGTTGDGYAVAKALGHSVSRVFPILTGIECSAENVDFRNLKGIRAKGTLTLFKDGKPVMRKNSDALNTDIVCEDGEIQFTEDGISGICAFNITPYIRVEKDEKPAEALKRYFISVDLASDFSHDEIAGRTTSFGIVTAALAEAVDPVELKNWKLQIDGIKGWKNAQATSGGVVLDEINMETMESKLVRGLYFAGEIIDVQGPCGGFNLQNAWETGIRAAKSINSAAGEQEIT